MAGLPERITDDELGTSDLRNSQESQEHEHDFKCTLNAH